MGHTVIIDGEELRLAPMPDEHEFPEIERFPRQTIFSITDNHEDPKKPFTTLRLLEAAPNAFPNGPITLENGKVQGFAVGQQIGDALTDNSLHPDGYRMHDVLHIANMAVLGWSPVMRRNLHLKRRSNPDIDEIEDGGRAIGLEEGLFSFLGVCRVCRKDNHYTDIDIEMAALALLMKRNVASFVSPDVTLLGYREWIAAITTGHQVMMELVDAIATHEPGDPLEKTAYIVADLDERDIRLSLDQPTPLQ